MGDGDTATVLDLPTFKEKLPASPRANVSLQTLSVLLSLGLVICTGFLTSFLTISASNRALDAVLLQAEDSIAQCFETGEGKLYNMGKVVMDLVLDKLEVEVLEYLLAPITTIESLHVAAHFAAAVGGVDATGPVQEAVWNIFKKGFARGVAESGITVDMERTTTLHYAESNETLNTPGDGYHEFVGTTFVGSRGTNLTTITRTADSNGLLRYGPGCCPTCPSESNGNMSRGLCMNNTWDLHRANLTLNLQPDEGMRITLEPFNRHLVLAFASRIANGTSYASVNTDTVSDLASSLSEKVGFTGSRLLALIGDGVCEAKYILAASHGSAKSLIPDGTGELVAQPLEVTNSSDPVIAALGHWLRSDHETHAGLVMHDWVHDNVSYWVEAREMNYSSFRFRVVYLVPVDEVLQNITLANNAAREKISASHREAEDSRNTDFNAMVVAVCLISALLVGVSIAFTRLGMLPLRRLEGEMNAVATMQLEQVDETRPLSFIIEVSKMQTSFLAMTRCLREYRAFLPDALLLSGHCVSPRHSSEEIEESELPNAQAEVCPSPGVRQECVHAMGVELRVGKATVMVTTLPDLAVDHDGFHRVNEVVESVCEAVKRLGGIVLHFNTSKVTSTWNTHRPCLRHARNACQAALAMRGWGLSGTAIGSGYVRIGHLGSAVQRAPFVAGTTVELVDDVVRLCPRLETMILITEAVQGMVQAVMDTRPVDVVQSLERGAGDIPYVTLFELRDGTVLNSPIRSLYANGFGCLRFNRFHEAYSAFKGVLQDTSDKQALRLLRLASGASQNVITLPNPYYRRRLDWVDHESPTRALPIPADIAQREAETAEESTDSDGLPVIYPEPTVDLKQELEESRGGEGVGDLPLEFVDRRGSKWTRSNSLLGSGSFGQVWLGMGDDGGLVALKTMSIAFPTSSPRSKRVREKRQREEIASLVHEVSLMCNLRHENIVTYLGSAVTNGHIILCMEYVSGGSLHQVLERFQVLSVPTSKRYTRDVLAGLAYLHSNDIVHRDLKPGNILLQIDGQCKLADFGAASSSLELRPLRQRIVGTPIYIAPESCRGEVGYAADIWAVGIILTQMVSGSIPYDITADFDIRAHINNLAAGVLRPSIPTEIPDDDAERFIASCLADLPAARPSAEQLLVHPFLVS
eukprot:Sspe_Gene.48098::Locus_24803_Transcript_1_1_Confidence_1.000_Length_3507::g.48098::m.48098